MILLEGEEIVLEKRRHWLPIAFEATTFLILGLVPPAIFLMKDFLTPEVSGFLLTYKTQLLFFYFAWLELAWAAFFIFWTNYYLDILLVTNKGIIDIEQIGLFNRDVSRLNFENIQDVRVQVEGFLPSLLGFGNLYIQTAGEKREFLIKDTPDPYSVQKLILKQKTLVSR